MSDAALTIERLFTAPDLAGAVPRHVRFSPDGKWLAWLAPGRQWQQLELWVLDIGSGKSWCLLDADGMTTSEPLTAAEMERRERTRTSSTGFVQFEWRRDSQALLVPHGGALFEKHLDAAPVRQLTPVGTSQSDFQQSPDGRTIAYVRQGQLFVLDVDGGRERALTPEPGDPVTYGLADFISQEEMHQFRGHWFAPDGKRIALLRVDTSPIPVSHRHEVHADGVRIISQRYPYAGGPNADVTLILCDVATGTLTDVRWRDRDDDYLARVSFARDGALLVQRQSRDQQRLDLLRIDATGGSRVLLSETARTWVNLHDNLQPLADGRCLWTSEREGYSRLYLGDADGRLTVLSDVGQSVSRVLAVTHTGTRAWWLGWTDDPGENRLFHTAIAGPTESAPSAGRPPSSTLQASTTRGIHDAEVAGDGARVALLHSNAETPTVLLLQDAGGLRPVANALAGPHPYIPFTSTHPRLERGALPAEDGQPLWWRLWLPANGTPAAVLLSVYGGPGVQRARNDWPTPWHLFLTRRGFAVFELDNRGSANRGRAFEAPIHGRMGQVEVRDQLRGVDYLVNERRFAADRIAVHGHSYGGYMTLMLLAQAPDRFRCGISVAPVCDWRLYDTHYTERYLGSPDANADGYAGSNVESHLHQLSAPLLLIHGMADDNVLFTHSVRIADALQRRNVQFRLMAYPGARHGLWEHHVAIHRHQLMYDFLREHLNVD